MIDVKVTKIRLDRKISKLQRRAKNTIPLMAEIAGDMMDAVEENFEKEGRPKWKKLAPSTLNHRKKANLNGPILQPGRAGGLASSINYRHGKTFSAVGTNKKYAAIHHFGGTVKHPGGTPYIVTDKGATFLKKDGNYPKNTKFTEPHEIKIPARPFLKLTDGDVKQIENRVGRFFSGKNG